jgi:DNA transposition AAA+ family ATPase
MASVVNPNEGDQPSEEALIVRLRRFVEDSDLSLYKIASRIGTSGTKLSAGTARPQMTELDEIEKFLKR